jgi:hypothetical protein
MWAIMLEFGGALAQNYQLDKKTWFRTISVGAAGVFGGYAVPFWLPGLLQWARSLGESANVAPGVLDTIVSPGGVTASAVSASVSGQPLLWYRLLPNSTYGEGILLGLVLAVLPLIAILVYLAITRRWKLNLLQKLSIVLPLLAFLVVGLIVSVKIGGGGDLHNLDMFIIGLMFAAAIAWRNGAFQWIDEIPTAPVWVQFMLVALILIPGYQPCCTWCRSRSQKTEKQSPLWQTLLRIPCPILYQIPCHPKRIPIKPWNASNGLLQGKPSPERCSSWINASCLRLAI